MQVAGAEADEGASEQGGVPVNRLWRGTAGAAFVVAATAFQMLRQDGVHMWRTVWAEDGGLFYLTALERPLHEVVFQGYAGYGLVLPRLLAAFGVMLPPEWFSYYATGVSCLIVSLLALFVYYASAPLLRSPISQGVLTVAVVAMPMLGFELLGNITNLHWFLPLACLFAVLFPVERPAAIIVRTVIALLSPLTSPLCVIFVPIALWRGWRALTGAAPRVTMVVPVALLVGSLGQVLMVLATDQPSDEKPAIADLAVDATKLYSTRVVTTGLFGIRTTEQLWESMGYGLAIAGCLFLVILSVFKWRGATTTSRTISVGLLATSVALYSFSMYQRAAQIPDLLSSNDGPFSFGGARYEVFPVLLVLVALLLPKRLEWSELRDGLAPPPPRLSVDARRHKPTLVLGALWIAVAVVPSYRLTNARSHGPVWQVSVDEAQDQCRVTGDSTAVVRFSPPPLWMVELECVDLEASGLSGTGGDGSGQSTAGR